MGTPLVSTRSEKRTPRRPGRPPSRIRKVTVSVRIPTDLDVFLTDYSDEHGMLKGEVIAEAVMLFRLNKKTNSPTSPMVRTATVG